MPCFELEAKCNKCGKEIKLRLGGFGLTGRNIEEDAIKILNKICICKKEEKNG